MEYRTKEDEKGTRMPSELWWGASAVITGEAPRVLLETEVMLWSSVSQNQCTHQPLGDPVKRQTLIQ